MSRAIAEDSGIVPGLLGGSGIDSDEDSEVVQI